MKSRLQQKKRKQATKTKASTDSSSLTPDGLAVLSAPHGSIFLLSKNGERNSAASIRELFSWLQVPR